MLNRLGVDHKCDRQTDGRMDGQTISYSADRPISIKWRVQTDLQTLITPQRELMTRLSCD